MHFWIIQFGRYQPWNWTHGTYLFVEIRFIVMFIHCNNNQMQVTCFINLHNLITVYCSSNAKGCFSATCYCFDLFCFLWSGQLFTWKSYLAYQNVWLSGMVRVDCFSIPFMYNTPIDCFSIPFMYSTPIDCLGVSLIQKEPICISNYKMLHLSGHSVVNRSALWTEMSGYVRLHYIASQLFLSTWYRSFQKDASL